jgi:hypothetical protein
MNNIFPTVLIAVFLILAGCSSSQYLVDKPYVIYPQSFLKEESAIVQEKSMKALLDSFADYKWEIHGIDRENHTVTAESCRRGQHCAEVLATVRNDGTIEIIRTPGQKLTENEGALLQRWLRNVNKAHNKHMQTNR